MFLVADEVNVAKSTMSVPFKECSMKTTNFWRDYMSFFLLRHFFTALFSVENYNVRLFPIKMCWHSTGYSDDWVRYLMLYDDIYSIAP